MVEMTFEQSAKCKEVSCQLENQAANNGHMTEDSDVDIDAEAVGRNSEI